MAQELWTRTGPVSLPIPTERQAEAVAETVAISDPVPLGMISLGITTLLVGVFMISRITTETLALGMPALVLVGGLGCFLAGMWAFKKGNTFAATLFSSVGVMWAGLGVFAWTFAGGVVHTTLTTSPLIQAISGWYWVAFAALTFTLWIPSLRVNAIMALCMTLFTASLTLAAIAAFTDTTGLFTAAGIIFLATALCTWYATVAELLNTTAERQLLPLGLTRGTRRMSPPPTVH